MSNRSHDQRAIERLARESQVPLGEVAQLYDDARARLEVGARVRGFLGILPSAMSARCCVNGAPATGGVFRGK